MIFSGADAVVTTTSILYYEILGPSKIRLKGARTKRSKLHPGYPWQ